MFRTIFKNIKTTLVGSFTGLPILIQGIQNGSINSIITGAGLFFIGLLSKDHDITGN